MTTIPERQRSAIYHQLIGDIVVTTLSDGLLTGSMAVLQNISEAESSAMLVDAFRPVPRQTAINTFLIQAGGRTALIDTGCGRTMGDTVGKLPEHLAAAGIKPGDIDLVLLTHMHPDHSNGLVSETGEAVFRNAELGMHVDEHSYWTSDVEAARVTATGQGLPYFQGARAQIAPYRDRMRLFRGGEVFPGVTVVLLPGHTPGHCGYLISSGDDSLLIWGDIVHVPEVQVPRPEVAMQFDVDPDLAARTRLKIFDQVSTDRQRVTGMHLHFPGFAHLARENDRYRLYPEAWRQALD